MVERTVSPPAIVATGVSVEDYLEKYAADHHEWVKGDVIKMTPVSIKHAELVDYLKSLFKAYLALNPIGRVFGEPFVMRLDAIERVREPDLQVILHTNPGQLTDTGMIGPADLCIEVVSPESTGRDHGEKFEEYEKAGVGEYWIIDPIRQECRFYRLHESGIYLAAAPDETGHYRTPTLPRLMLHVPTLWQNELPNIFAVTQSVRALFE
jgi:Uma2 family endonuclease